MQPNLRPNLQSGAAPAVRHGAKFNALKHGLYAESIVLPEEDLEAFRRSRQMAFLEFRPQTVDEAEHVDAMVECRWQLKRCRALQAVADAQTLHPEQDTARRLVEPLTHQRTHTTMDVTVHRNRIDKLESRHRAKLREAQRMRRLGLVEGAAKLPPGCYMDVTGEVVQVIETPRVPTRVCQVADLVPQPVPPVGVSDSTDRPNGFREEQQETVATQPALGLMGTLPAAARSDWPLHVDSAAWMAANFGGARAMADAPTSGEWPGGRLGAA